MGVSEFETHDLKLRAHLLQFEGVVEVETGPELDPLGVEEFQAYFLAVLR
jgi:hypothetical protein